MNLLTLLLKVCVILLSEPVTFALSCFILHYFTNPGILSYLSNKMVSQLMTRTGGKELKQ